MKKILLPLLFLLTFTSRLAAQNWSVGVHTGPFVFGDLVERTFRLGNEGPSGEAETTVLTAATRPGLGVDFERNFGSRWAIRFEGAFTRSPLAVGSTDDEQFEIEAGQLDVATFMAPIVFRINRNGSLRFHLMAGPAYAAYRIERERANTTIPVFEGTRAEWGLAVGGGVAWHLSERLAVEGNLVDIATKSPFREEDFLTPRGLDIPETHNVHTTVGLRYRF